MVVSFAFQIVHSNDHRCCSLPYRNGVLLTAMVSLFLFSRFDDSDASLGKGAWLLLHLLKHSTDVDTCLISSIQLLVFFLSLESSILPTLIVQLFLDSVAFTLSLSLFIGSLVVLELFDRHFSIVA